MKKKESADEKLMYEIAQENKRMSEPLNKALEDVERLRKELTEYKIIKEKLRSEDKQMKAYEAKLDTLNWEHEILLQKYQMVESDRKHLHDQFQLCIAEVKQKAGFKHLFLLKQLDIAQGL